MKSAVVMQPPPRPRAYSFAQCVSRGISAAPDPCYTNRRATVVRRELEAAGFKVIAEGDFWHHPEDTRDFTTQRPTGPVNEFVLKFQKPM
jgi:predicted methyltransferase